MNSNERILIKLIESHKKICGIILELFTLKDINPDNRVYLEYFSKAELNLEYFSKAELNLEYFSKAELNEIIGNINEDLNIKDLSVKEKIYEILDSLNKVIDDLYNESDLYQKGYKMALEQVKKEVDKIK